MRLKRCIFTLMFLVAILILPSSVQALDLKLTYNEKWNECVDDVWTLSSYDNAGNVDGNLVIYNSKQLKQNGNSSGIGIAKLDLNNKIVYKDKTFEASNVDVSTIDSSNSGGYVVKGEADILITAYDENDNVIFEKQYGGNGIDADPEAINSYDNNGVLDGYLILFITTSSDLGIEQGFTLLKVGLDGDIVWVKNLNEQFRLGGLLYTKNQSIYAISGINNTKLTSENLFAGDVAWKKETGIEIKNINYSYDKNGVIDGIVVVGGISGNNNYSGIIAKYDLNGNEIFRSSYDGKVVSSMYFDVTGSYLPDGTYDGYIVTAASDDNRTFLVKYDLNGKKVSEIVYSNNSNLIFEIANNFDKSGNQNGYLLYALEHKKDLLRENDVETRDLSCKNLIVAKYTYDMFSVAKEETSGGTITVKSDAYPGELVKVKVLVKEGYSLARIIVKDESGKEIEVNSDGTFVMPEGKVTVSAIYKRVTNPDTVSAAYMVLGVVLLIAVGSLIVIRQNNKKNN